jgi:transposase
MSENPFWLSEDQFEKLRPLLPDKVRGVARVDDRRVISGIVHVLKSGCRWADVPSEYGPRKTLYNRWRRWAEKGHWVRIFEALADEGGPPSQALIDSSAVRAHRSAAGAKGGRLIRRSGAAAAAGRPRSTRSRTASAARSGSC